MTRNKEKIILKSNLEKESWNDYFDKAIVLFHYLKMDVLKHN